jgi:hypothetical protein
VVFLVALLACPLLLGPAFVVSFSSELPVGVEAREGVLLNSETLSSSSAIVQGNANDEFDELGCE